MGTAPQIADTDQIIFFDGVCNLCNSSVLFIIKRDSQSKFRFAPLQSAVAVKIIGKDFKHMESIMLYRKGRIYKKSTAALYIAKELDGAWWLLFPFVLIPSFIRDFFYDLIAKNRYRWFGKQAQCMVPTPELKARFLDSD